MRFYKNDWFYGFLPDSSRAACLYEREVLNRICLN